MKRKDEAMDIKESINDTRKGFEESFATGDFYNRQTRDSDHLEEEGHSYRVRGSTGEAQ